MSKRNPANDGTPDWLAAGKLLDGVKVPKKNRLFYNPWTDRVESIIGKFRNKIPWLR